MVDAMQTGRYQKPGETPFPDKRQPDIRVVEKDAEEQERLPGSIHRGGRTDQLYLGRSKGDGDGNLSEVEAERRGCVHFAVDVVNTMKSPEDRHPVCQDVPDVQGIVEEQNRRNLFHPRRTWKNPQQPGVLLLRPAGDRDGDRSFK